MPVIPCFGRDEPGLVNNNHSSPPFFVSVASKGVSIAVSLLFSTLARRFTSVENKRLTDAIHRIERSGMGDMEISRD